MRDAEIRLGSVLGPGYGLERIIDVTGAGAVYEAVHEDRPNDRFAVKVFDPKVASSPEFIMALRREADLATVLGGPHVVRVFDVGQDEDGAPFIVLEMLRGEDLARRILRNRLTPVQAASLVNQLARTLEAAHSAGIVHGDLRPSRIFFTQQDGQEDFVKILGFGSPRLHSSLETAPPHAIAYLSPEQVTGEPVDRRADIFAVGAMLYECLTGISPYLAPTAPATLQRIKTYEPAPAQMMAPDLPDAAEAVLRRALTKSPENRYGTMAFLRDEFMRALGLEAQQAVRPPPLPGPSGPRPPPLPGARGAAAPPVPVAPPPAVPSARPPVSRETLDALGELGFRGVAQAPPPLPPPLPHAPPPVPAPPAAPPAPAVEADSPVEAEPIEEEGIAEGVEEEAGQELAEPVALAEVLSAELGAVAPPEPTPPVAVREPTPVPPAAPREPTPLPPPHVFAPEPELVAPREPTPVPPAARREPTPLPPPHVVAPEEIATAPEPTPAPPPAPVVAAPLPPAPAPAESAPAAPAPIPTPTPTPPAPLAAKPPVEIAPLRPPAPSRRAASPAEREIPSTQPTVERLRAHQAPEAGGPRKRLPFGVIAAAGVLALGGIWWLTSRGANEPVAVAPLDPSPSEGTPPPSPAPPAPTGAPSAEPTPAAPRPTTAPSPEPTQATPPPAPAVAQGTVAIHLLLKPEHARVVLDGLATKTNPIVLPKDNLSHKLVIAAPGYYPESREFRAQLDGEVAVTLRPEKARAAARPQPGASKKQGPVETEW